MNSLYSRLSSAYVAVAFVTLFAGAARAGEPGVSDTEIVIGQTLTLQGGKNDYGVAAQHGARLYFDALNAAGGVNGRKVVVRGLDDDNKPATADANARKLVGDGAFLLFGPIEGGPSTAVAKVAAELKVPLFGPMAGPPGLRRPLLPTVFPVRAEHRDEFRALMTWGQSTGLKTVAFFHADSDTGRQHVENVRKIAAEVGMTVKLLLPFKADASDADIAAMSRTLVDARPDMVFNHGAVGLYQKLIRASKEAGSKATFMGVNSGSSQIAKGLGPLADGMVFAQVVPSPWERKREVAREYQDAAHKADGAQAELSYGGMEGYMTAKALVLALRAAGRELTRAGFVKTLETTPLDLGGVRVRYSPAEHEGSRFVDLSMVTAGGRFIH